MVKNFEYIDSDGNQRKIRISDDSYFIIKYESEFNKPLKEGLQDQSVDSTLKLVFAMEVTDEKKSYHEWLKSLKLPFKEITNLMNEVTDLIGIEPEEDSEKN